MNEIRSKAAPLQVAFFFALFVPFRLRQARRRDGFLRLFSFLLAQGDHWIDSDRAPSGHHAGEKSG